MMTVVMDLTSLLLWMETHFDVDSSSYLVWLFAADTAEVYFVEDAVDVCGSMEINLIIDSSNIK